MRAGCSERHRRRTYWTLSSGKRSVRFCTSGTVEPQLHSLMRTSPDGSGRALMAAETQLEWRSTNPVDAATRVRPSPSVSAGATTVHLVNPSHLSFGVG